MKTIWKMIKRQNWENKTKQHFFILVMTVFWSLLGAAAWLLIGNRLLSIDYYLLAFIGYPGFFLGLIGSIIYLYNHEL